MMESKGFSSNISFKLRNENGKLVSLNGQSITIRYQSKIFKTKECLKR